MKTTEHRNSHSRRRRKRRRKYLRQFFRTAFSILLFGAILFTGSKVFSSLPEEYKKPVSDLSIFTRQEQQASTDDMDVDFNLNIDLDHLYSPYAVLTDLNSGTVIGAHKSDEKIYPASLTKIMTAVLAIENTEDLEQTITLSDDLFQLLYIQHASMAGFQPGETVRMIDLLYGILLPSGAECCLAFANQISGSEDQFVMLMNEKAEDWGMKNTHFTNSTGLHDPEHYSTVEDISILLQYALKNETFREVFTSVRHSIPPTDRHPDGFTFQSSMFQSMGYDLTVTGGKILGGKTGYTGEAGLCLASLAQIDGKEYILITAKADGNHQTEQFHILDAINVYNQIGEITKSKAETL